jgi:hypothetical protein
VPPPPQDPALLTDREGRILLSGLNIAGLMAECDISAGTIAAAFGVSPSLARDWKAGRTAPRSPPARLGWLRFCLGLARHLEICEPARIPCPDWDTCSCPCTPCQRYQVHDYCGHGKGCHIGCSAPPPPRE